MNQHPEYYENELSLEDIMRFFSSNGRMILATTFGFILLGFLMALVLPKKWEASALVEVAKVNNQQIEPSLTAVARVTQKSFKSEVLESVDGKVSGAKLDLDSIKATKLKDADLIEVSLKGLSPESAELKINVAVSKLQQSHVASFEAAVHAIDMNLKGASAQIDQLQKELEQVNLKLQNQHEWNAYNVVLSALVSQEKCKQLAELKERKLNYELMLDPALTFNTRLVGNISVSDAPVFPNIPLFAVLSGLLGFFLSLLVAYFRGFSAAK